MEQRRVKLLCWIQWGKSIQWNSPSSLAPKLCWETYSTMNHTSPTSKGEKFLRNYPGIPDETSRGNQRTGMRVSEGWYLERMTVFLFCIFYWGVITYSKTKLFGVWLGFGFFVFPGRIIDSRVKMIVCEQVLCLHVWINVYLYGNNSLHVL